MGDRCREADEAGREWPLAGREDEIAAIEAGYRTLGVQGVVLTGARGVGKSRAAREAADRLQADGRRVAWVSARRGMRSIPFGAIAHLVPGADSGFALLSRLTSDLRAAGSDRTVVVVDDAHQLDDESAAVLAGLVAQRLVFLIITIAAGGRAPEALTALWNGGGITVLSINPLAVDVMDRLVDGLFGAQLDVIGRRRLARAADGNPLALRALADPAARGLAGQWLDEAGPIVRGVVEVVACAEPLPMRLLETVVEPAAIAAAEQAGLVRVADDGEGPTVRVAPPLSGPVVRFLLPRSAIRCVYRRLTTALGQRSTILDEDVLRAGEWQLKAGTVTAPEHLLPAARRALARYDLDLAADLAAAARASRPGTAADLLLARILLRQGQGRRAADVLPAQPPSDPREAAAWALTAAEIQYFGLGESAHMAERTLESVIQQRDQAEAKRSWIQLADGRADQALSTAQSVLSQVDAGPRAKVWAAAAGVAAAGLLGRAALSEVIFQQGEQSPWEAVEVGYGACLARLLRGDVRQAQDMADRGYNEAVAAGARSMAGVWAGLGGMAAKARGRVRLAASRLREALALSEGDGLSGLRTAWTAELAAVTAMAGDAASADSLLSQVDGRDTWDAALFEPWIALGRAWSHAAAGDISQAVESCRLAADLSRKHGHVAHEAIALYDAARLGAADAVQARLADLARTVEGDLVAVIAVATDGLAHRDTDALGQATDAFDGLGLTLLAAETATTTAHAHRLGGRHTSASLCQERADSLALHCEGARTPLLDQWRLRSRLTPREQEVVLLASTLTTPQIAARLGLSPRTVSNYLQHAYEKLGLTGRSELRSLLGT